MEFLIIVNIYQKFRIATKIQTLLDSQKISPKFVLIFSLGNSAGKKSTDTENISFFLYASVNVKIIAKNTVYGHDVQTVDDGGQLKQCQ